MSIAVLEQIRMSRAVFPTGDRSTGPDVRLPLRSDVFLIAHDDDSGSCHIDRDWLCRGLAGAILLELWLAGRVSIGLRYDARHGRSTPETGVISIEDSRLVNDPLTDTAMTLLHRSGAMTAKAFIAGSPPRTCMSGCVGT